MRVLHAPEDIAGQASTLAKAQRELGMKADVLIFNQKTSMRPHDINLSLSEKSMVTKYFVLLFNFIKCFSRYDIFHFHFGESLLPHNLDLPIFKLFGKKTVMHYWGSDIRQSDVAINYVYFKIPDELHKIYHQKDYNKKRKKIRKIEKYVNLTIVGDYPYLVFSPNSIVLKQALDVSKIPFVGCENRNGKIKIIHAPTDREKKGTKYVLDAVERLKREKYNIDFILIEKQPNDVVLEICKNADIIVDALLLESHGIFSMESMALGKPVLCRTDEKFLKYYPGLPILRTDPDNLYENLKLLIENPDLRKELGEKGRKYVEEMHDSKKIAKQLIELYKLWC
jgi:glycosyltransferase involved in cell wall biosynthesis